MQPVVEARGLTRSYPGRKGVFDLSFAVAGGEIFGYLGPNGAGKTTTIRMMVNLIRPMRGGIHLFGLPPQRWALRGEGRIGYLPGDPGYPEHLTGERALDFWADLGGRGSPLRGWLCERLDFPSEDRRRRIKTYSKGMRQKLGLVQAIQHDPELLILDEPTAGLDPLSQRALCDALRELKARGRTVFFSTHILSEAQALCDRVGVLMNGRLVLDEPVHAMMERAERLLWVRYEASVSELADDVPPILGAEFLRSDGDWIVYRADPARMREVLGDLSELSPRDFRLEAALEDSFLQLYREHSGPAAP
jgi:ABC-2 type transport system ATP-binding protein